MGQVKAVILDVGGVLVDLDGMPSLAALLNTTESPERTHQRWMSSPSVVAHETGRISEGVFASGIVADLGLQIEPEQFLEDFRRWPRAAHPGVVSLLDAIPQAYKLVALSNVSAAHWKRIQAMGFTHRFTRTYLSYETGFLKPVMAAFQFALNDMGFQPSQTMFFDDAEANVSAAKQLGIDAHLARNPQDVERVLRDCGIIPPIV